MYGKFFRRCFTGSMVGAGADVFAVWVYAISNAVKSRVELNPEYLSRVIGSSRGDMEKAIEYLCKPDANSTHSESGGRRLVKEGMFQYFLPQFDRYQKIKNNDDLREANRIRQAEYRAKKKWPNKAPELPGSNAYVKGVDLGTIDKDGVPIRPDEPEDAREVF